jgi:hypothetical protein
MEGLAACRSPEGRVMEGLAAIHFLIATVNSTILALELSHFMILSVILL